MIKYSDLPVDANGILHGVFRLVHIDPTFHGGVGAITMRDGVAQEPVAGRQLRYVVAEFGHKLFLEPWGELPKGYQLPELVRVDLTEAELAKLERAPWREVLADALMPLTDEQLMSTPDHGAAETMQDAPPPGDELPPVLATTDGGETTQDGSSSSETSTPPSTQAPAERKKGGKPKI